VAGGGGLPAGDERDELADAAGAGGEALDEREAHGVPEGLEDAGFRGVVVHEDPFTANPTYSDYAMN
jgi:hypothetical protein